VKVISKDQMSQLYTRTTRIDTRTTLLEILAHVPVLMSQTLKGKPCQTKTSATCLNNNPGHGTICYEGVQAKLSFYLGCVSGRTQNVSPYNFSREVRL